MHLQIIRHFGNFSILLTRGTPKLGSNAFPGLWTAIEASLGIVAACFPSLGPILHIISGKSFAATNDARSARKHTYARFEHQGAISAENQTDSLERILNRGPQGRDEAIIMNTIEGHTAVKDGLGQAAMISEYATPADNRNRTQIASGILVTKDLDQRVE